MTFLTKSKKARAKDLRLELISTRPEFPEDFQAINKAANLCERNTDDWVRVWIDPGHEFRDEQTSATARRAITDEGQLIWMVLVDGKRFAFHASAQKVHDAFVQATEAAENRRAIARQWRKVKQLRRNILLLKTRVRPTMDDARKSGLCDLGIQGFLRRTGLGKRP